MSQVQSLQFQIEQAREPHEVREALLSYRGSRLEAAETIALHSPVWDEGLLFSIFLSDASSPLLLQNSRLPGWAKEQLARWEANRLRTERAAVARDCARESLVRLIGEGHLPVEGPVMQELLTFVRSAPEGAVRFTLQQAAAMELLLAHPEVTEREVRLIAEHVVSFIDQESRGTLLLHPRCPADVRQQILSSGFEFYRAEGARKRALCEAALRQLPEVRAALLDYARRGPILATYVLLIRDGLPDAGELFREFRERKPELAANLLEQCSETLVAHLAAEDLLPFLGSSESRLRLLAIRLSGQLQGEAVGSAPAARGR